MFFVKKQKNPQMFLAKYQKNPQMFGLFGNERRMVNERYKEYDGACFGRYAQCSCCYIIAPTA